MAEDWTAQVKKYVPDADDKAIAGIVRHVWTAPAAQGKND